jgi:hypothetical protein
MHKRSLIEKIGPWSLKTKVADDQEFLKRLWAHKVKIGFYREISTLKFPAIFWKMYSLSSDFPQSEYVNVMNRDAVGFRQEMLLDFVSTLSKHYGGLRRRNRYIEPLFNLLRFVLGRYGYHRWPISHLLYRQYRRRVGLHKKNEADSISADPANSHNDWEHACARRHTGFNVHSQYFHRSSEAGVCDGEAAAVPRLLRGCPDSGRGERGMFLIIRDYEERKSIVF